MGLGVVEVAADGNNFYQQHSTDIRYSDMTIKISVFVKRTESDEDRAEEAVCWLN